MLFEVSEWVQGKSADGEFIHGYIETMDVPHGIARVRVVQSDNEEAVGRVIAVRDTWLKKLPVNPLEDMKNIESLIDIALATMDEAWFHELSDRLSAMDKGRGKENQDSQFNGWFNNRLGLYEKK